MEPLVEPQRFHEVRHRLRASRGEPSLWAELLHLHWIADQPWAAEQVWREATHQLPEPQWPHLTYANVLRDLNGFEAAHRVYARARELASGAQRHAVAWNHSQLLLGLERYEQAYALAEERLLMAHQETWRAAPWWQGWSPDPAVAGPLTVWSEQGLGDTLQYLRWLPLLIEHGHRLRLEVEPPLLTLLREGLSWLGPTLSVGVKGIEPRPAAGLCQGSLLSLPWLLGQAPLAEVFRGPGRSLGTSGNRIAPQGYLRSPLWPTPAPPDGRPPRIGLVWAAGRKGGMSFVRREYRRRSLPAAALVALLEGLAACDAELVCLQFGPDRERADGWSGRFSASLADSISLAANARCIAGLDLVITVDTANAHLVGAMARPGWVLLPWAADPRWLRDRQDSPWYPTLTLLRQPSHGDWAGLVERVLARFRAWRAAWPP